jgi:hypothetical protein
MAHLRALLGRIPIPTPEIYSRRGIALSLGAAILLLPINAQVLLSEPAPSVPCPLPFPLVWLMFLGEPSWIVIAIPSIMFYFWSRPCFRGSLISSSRTLIAMALVGVGSVWWFRGGWDFGIRHQGYQYTFYTAILSFLLAAATAGTFLASRRTGSLPLSVAANFVLFAWASTFAFPYLGELP